MTTPTPDYPAAAPRVEAGVKDNPKRPNKALYSGIATLVAVFLVYWIADPGRFRPVDARDAFLAALLASGLIGGGTFAIPNPKVRKTHRDVEKDRQKRIRKGQRGAARPETLILGAVLLIVALMLLFWVILPAARQ